MQWNGSYQLLVYSGDVNLLGYNRHIIKKNTEALLVPTKEVSPEVNTYKKKYMFLPHQKNTGQNDNIKIAIKLFENVAEFIYLGMTQKLHV